VTDVTPPSGRPNTAPAPSENRAQVRSPLATCPTSPVHPIEAESYRLLAGRCDLSGYAPGPRAVIERVLHATADFSFAGSLLVPPESVQAGVTALRAGAPVVADVEMVRAGISYRRAECFLAAARADRGQAPTLSARAIELSVARHPDGAVFAIGCAPTALEALLALVAGGAARPALVIGVPVGLVGAAEAKERLAEQGSISSITNRGERGGSSAAVAVVNALARLAFGTPAGQATPPGSSSSALSGTGTGRSKSAGLARHEP
jgi:precorrin-8X/cobalt-precorrin-8 methylmutase